MIATHFKIDLFNHSVQIYPRCHGHGTAGSGTVSMLSILTLKVAQEAGLKITLHCGEKFHVVRRDPRHLHRQSPWWTLHPIDWVMPCCCRHCWTNK
eukprot:scaffold246015_cov55-Attheya_sp.AAC.1